MFLDKAKFCLDGIIGHPYGTTFEVINGKMVKLDKTAAQMDTEQTGKGGITLQIRKQLNRKL